jgi:hypothetical protein
LQEQSVAAAVIYHMGSSPVGLIFHCWEILQAEVGRPPGGGHQVVGGRTILRNSNHLFKCFRPCKHNVDPGSLFVGSGLRG